MKGVDLEEPWIPDTPVKTRYITSVYRVMNSLDHGKTDGEMVFAIFATFVRYVELNFIDRERLCIHPRANRMQYESGYF
eukprot:SAG31_NODE_23287_length_507_cov_0.911765_2_plen_79_part_00